MMKNEIMSFIMQACFHAKKFQKKFDLHRFRTSNNIDQITILEFVFNDDLNQMHQWEFR